MGASAAGAEGSATGAVSVGLTSSTGAGAAAASVVDITIRDKGELREQGVRNNKTVEWMSREVLKTRERRGGSPYRRREGKEEEGRDTVA